MILTLEECRKHLCGYKLTDDEILEIYNCIKAISESLLDELFAEELQTTERAAYGS